MGAMHREIPRCRDRRRRRVLLRAGAAVLAGWHAAGRSQAVAANIDELKAAYLYRFVGYIDWPEAAFASPEAPLAFAVAGADAVHAELVRVLAGRNLMGRPLVARRVAPGDALEGVHVLYVGDAGLMRGPWLQRQRDRPILIVAYGPQGLDAGAAIAFAPVQDRLRFEASLRAFERAGLKVSSRLLALAQRVVGNP